MVVTRVTVTVEKPGGQAQRKDLYLNEKQIKAIEDFGIAGRDADVAAWCVAELESMITCLEDISRVR